MEFTITLGLGGWVALAALALLFGAVIQAIGRPAVGFEWLVAAIAGFIGGLAASEFIVAWQGLEPVWDGLALAPAVIGIVVVGGIADLVVRYVGGGTWADQGHPA